MVGGVRDVGGRPAFAQRAGLMAIASGETSVAGARDRVGNRRGSGSGPSGQQDVKTGPRPRLAVWPRNSSRTLTRSAAGATETMVPCMPWSGPWAISTSSPTWMTGETENVSSSSSERLADFLAEGLHERIRDGGDFRAEADEPAHPLAEGDGALHLGEVEFGEQVAGKQRLHPPDLAAAGGLAVAQARAENLDAFEFPQVSGGDVFAFGLRRARKTIPGAFGIVVKSLAENFLKDGKDPAAAAHPLSRRSTRSVRNFR